MVYSGAEAYILGMNDSELRPQVSFNKTRGLSLRHYLDCNATERAPINFIIIRHIESAI